MEGGERERERLRQGPRKGRGVKERQGVWGKEGGRG